MIAGLRGIVQRIEQAGVVLGVGPVEVRVSVPGRILEGMAPGQELALRTHLYVREDQLALYGFRTGDELELFEALMQVSGVGPKAALSILTALESAEVRRAINTGDSHLLTRAQGVGARVAARIITDLQGKISVVDTDAEEGSSVQTGAMAALMAMGYSAMEAKRAVDSAADEDSVEALIRSALGFLADR